VVCEAREAGSGGRTVHCPAVEPDGEVRRATEVVVMGEAQQREHRDRERTDQ